MAQHNAICQGRDPLDSPTTHRYAPCLLGCVQLSTTAVDNPVNSHLMIRANARLMRPRYRSGIFCPLKKINKNQLVMLCDQEKKSRSLKALH